MDANAHVKEEEGAIEYELLVDHVHRHLAHSIIAPHAMDEQQAAEVGKLADGIVGRLNSLHTLVASDTHTYVRLLEHRDIIRAVADGKRERCRRRAALHHAHHLGLLAWRHAACDDRRTVEDDGKEEATELVIVYTVCECGPVDDNGEFASGARAAALLLLLLLLLRLAKAPLGDFGEPGSEHLTCVRRREKA